MAVSTAKPASVDAYIATFPPRVRAILRRIRATIRRTAPDAEHVISYRIPCAKQGGVLMYYAAFKSHIGIFPPVKGDAALMRALARYAGPKGNLRLPLDGPMPYDLIARIVKLRVKQNRPEGAAHRGRARR